jgi:E3 ubiquitin-protein ligase RNF213
LIRYASILRGVDLFILNIHAGRTESEIVDFIVECEEKAKTHQVWVFLDEINTCNHMGMINRLICHRIIKGRRVARNIAFFAASNPYRLKSGKTISAGLDTQQKKVPDKMSKLVYRVYPLPDTMMNYLWDFGSLAASDEEYYIKSIYADLCDFTPPIPPTIVDVLVEMVVVSHAFLRACEDVSAVSMRDVRRCKKLVEWFIKNKQAKPKREDVSYMSRLYRSFGFYTNTQSSAQETAETLSIAAVILGIAHCYRSRLPEVGLRNEYDNKLVEVFHRHDFRGYSADRIRAEITNEQMDYLNRMDLGPGIAKNDALLENIFVLLVCILVKMPIFLVGKPGSSKTLAMKRIEANLRGPDAKDAFFRLHNEVKVVSYQGSVSSTSEGVLQAFAKAKSYAEASDKSTVVVLFDEVGLAEISPWNPLKVLHALLEKSDFESNDDVSVVGLSNWSLDAAKMNRAIHISRPEPDLKQLHNTSLEIFRSLSDGRTPNDTIVGVLQGISQAYLEFYTDQLKSINHKNFHGLRDFYSCVKHIGKQCQFVNVSNGMIAEAVSRNFNGLLPGPENAFDRLTHNATRNASYSVKDLVSMNLKDKNCRHLLLITVGDTILNTVDSIFRDCGLGSPRIIIGSKLRGDQHESYHYRLLSEIIECMEIGTSIVLKDLDPIYGSLYDMLNQVLFLNKLYVYTDNNPM